MPVIDGTILFIHNILLRNCYGDILELIILSTELLLKNSVPQAIYCENINLDLKLNHFWDFCKSFMESIEAHTNVHMTSSIWRHNTFCSVTRMSFHEIWLPLRWFCPNIPTYSVLDKEINTLASVTYWFYDTRSSKVYIFLALARKISTLKELVS